MSFYLKIQKSGKNNTAQAASPRAGGWHGQTCLSVMKRIPCSCPRERLHTGKMPLPAHLKKKVLKSAWMAKGRCMDNVFIGCLRRSVNYKKIFLEEFKTVMELIIGLKKYSDLGELA